MADFPPYRHTARQHLRDAVITAGRDLAIDRGWDAVRMADVAARVGVSRQTLYNEFTNKAGLSEAIAHREIDRFMEGVREALSAHGSDVRAAVHAAVTFVLTQAGTDPLVKAVLNSARGTDDLLPYLTTRADLALAAAVTVLREWAGTHLPRVSPDDVTVGAESIARLVVSHIVLPTAPVDKTADTLADLAQRFLDPPRA
ncbi:TetR family transcriptional regulator [Micromonospora sp. WMMD1076]|uniref:TetR/AcrR family transcriptional regulator n=1 Tax=Micromonospora sp. WMMD1076 TaxID=3016103 RepID=UPI00249B9BBE|nr:TetR family transcriptional regulator [Micromonospora sp. WMMD1076]WFF05810.1 TetR family transcriptional regulator [Micromonospora sp. WMMD1076]